MFTTGEFAKLAQVSKRSLRHYKKIGLLEPAYTDLSNGYQYYSTNQLPILNRIIALKNLGLSLDQIARLIHDDVSIEAIRGMLIMKKAELEQQVREELAQIDMIESRLKQIETQADVVHDVVVKQIPEQWLLGVRLQIATQEEVQQLFVELIRALPMPNNAVYAPFMGILYDEDEDGSGDIELGRLVHRPEVPPTALASGIELAVRRLPAVDTMATFVVRGSALDAHIGYSAIGTWAETNRYKFCGAVREVILALPTDDNPDAMMTEIQFPVVKRQNRLSSENH